MVKVVPKQNRMISRKQGNVIYLDLFDFYPVPMRAELKLHFTVAGSLRWFRQRNLLDNIRRAGL